MKKFLLILLTILTLSAVSYLLIEFQAKLLIGLTFSIGTLFGIFIMNIFMISKNRMINSYARELEKESISSLENSSRVKVLESKIEVLEKALENALKNK